MAKVKKKEEPLLTDADFLNKEITIMDLVSGLFVPKISTPKPKRKSKKSLDT